MHVSSHTCISPATQMYAACMCLWCICVLYIFVLLIPDINVCSMHVYAICMCLWCICVLYIFVLLIPRPSVCLRNYLSTFCVLRLLFRIQYLCIAYTSPSRFPQDSKIFMSYVGYFFHLLLSWYKYHLILRSLYLPTVCQHIQSDWFDMCFIHDVLIFCRSIYSALMYSDTSPLGLPKDTFASASACAAW